MDKISDLKAKLPPLKDKFTAKFRDNQIEDFLRKNAIYSHDNFKESEPLDFLKDYELEQIGMGIHQRVFKLKNQKWILKEGRWDLSIDMIKGLKFPLPSNIFDSVFRFIGAQSINPHIWRVLDEYRIYMEFAQYFGYFENEDIYYHPNRDLIFIAQQNIRKSLLLFKPEIEKAYKIKLNGKLDKIFTSDIKFINFLPKEYLLIGKSVSAQNKGKTTALIFQEFVKGKVLRDIPESEMTEKHRKQLILLAYLILLMHMQIRLLPDTRPRYHVFEAYNWLTKTDNIILDEEKLTFIDTRWFWDTKSNLFKRGFLIPNLTIGKCKSTLLSLLDYDFN